MSEATPTGTAAGQFENGCDTADIYFVHNFLRSVFGDAPELVRGVAEGDLARAWIVSDHLFEIGEALHDHHQSEDQELWQRLEERDPGSGSHVSRMKAAHARIAQLLEQFTATLRDWRVDAGATDRDAAVALAKDLLQALRDHLDDEETTILPIAGRTISQPEWDRMGEFSRAKVPGDRLFIQLGFILASMPEADRDRWKKDYLPTTTRVGYDLVGRLQYERHRKMVYPAA